jgi:hypothetical protein
MAIECVITLLQRGLGDECHGRQRRTNKSTVFREDGSLTVRNPIFSATSTVDLAENFGYPHGCLDVSVRSKYVWIKRETLVRMIVDGMEFRFGERCKLEPGLHDVSVNTIGFEVLVRRIPKVIHR